MQVLYQLSYTPKGITILPVEEPRPDFKMSRIQPDDFISKDSIGENEPCNGMCQRWYSVQAVAPTEPAEDDQNSGGSYEDGRQEAALNHLLGEIGLSTRREYRTFEIPGTEVVALSIDENTQVNSWS